MRARRPSALQERAWMAAEAFHALGRGYAIRVERRNEDDFVGKLAGIPNEHHPEIELLEGGSNLLLRFEDGTVIPLERVTKLERARL